MSLASLIATGTKVWLDGVEPEQLKTNRARGITGATSNPSIVSRVISHGYCDGRISDFIAQGLDDHQIAWQLNDELVNSAQQVFLPVWQQTEGNDGYVSFELDPLIEDETFGLAHAERVSRYLDLAKKWSDGHGNRMIKVPATDAGLDALESIAAAGVTINVTLIFTQRQYLAARDAIWRGARRRKEGLHDFKSVYSIFVSRVDVYTQEHVTSLSPAAQGMAGIVNARRIWRENQEFWRDKGLRLQQEIVFASTGVKRPGEPPDKYVVALAGGDIQTNPGATNEAVENSSRAYSPQIDQMPPPRVVSELDEKVDVAAMERVLMDEGIRKFAGSQQMLLGLIVQQRVTHLRTRRRVNDNRRFREMSEQERMYPTPTREQTEQRKRLAPKPAEAFKAFSQSVFAEGALPAKVKQLIAVAVAHVTQCPYCIRGHTKAALQQGATPEEIMEAIWVAAEMRAGAAYAHSALALETIAPQAGEGGNR